MTAGLVRDWFRRPGVLAVGGAAIASLAVALPATGLAFTDRWDVPLNYSGDGLAVASHVKTILQTGWYEDQPALGAPYGQHYHDYPTQDDGQFLAIRLLGAIVPVWGVVMNLHFLIGFLLAGAAMAWLLLRVGVRAIPATALGVVYAIAPYHFFRAESHLFLSWYWVVPLGLVVVWRIVLGEPLWGARPGMPRGLGHLFGRSGGTVLCLVLLAWTSVYYAAFIAVLAACAALGAVIVRRDARRLVGTLAAGAVLVVALLLAAIPDWVYAWVNGPNPAALVRSPPGSEIYALKLTALLLPAPDHRFAPFAELRALYDRYYPVPSEDPALGIIGAIGLVVLVVVVAIALVRSLAGRVTPRGPWRTLGALGFLAFIALLFSWVGGVATLISFVSTSIRAWNRMSIVIAALALAAIGVLVDLAVARIARRARGAWARPVAATVIALGLVGLAYWDQVPARDDEARAATVASFDSDAAFAAAMESVLEPGSMVYQLPYQEFPESPAVGAAGDSDQLRLFLHSDALRFSGGGIKGRPEIDRNAEIAALPAEQLLPEIQDLGFSAVVLDRFADPDGAREADLVATAGRPTIESPDGRFAFWPVP